MNRVRELDEVTVYYSILHQILKNCSFEASIAPSTTGTTLATLIFALSSGIISMSIACTATTAQMHHMHHPQNMVGFRGL